MRPYVNNEDRIENGKLISTKHVESRHHIFEKVNWGTDRKENIVKLFDDTIHKSFHCLFGDELVRDNIKQLIRILGKALSEDFKNDLQKLIDGTDDLYCYKNGIYSKRLYESGLNTRQQLLEWLKKDDTL